MPRMAEVLQHAQHEHTIVCNGMAVTNCALVPRGARILGTGTCIPYIGSRGPPYWTFGPYHVVLPVLPVWPCARFSLLGSTRC